MEAGEPLAYINVINQAIKYSNRGPRFCMNLTDRAIRNMEHKDKTWQPVLELDAETFRFFTDTTLVAADFDESGGYSWEELYGLMKGMYGDHAAVFRTKSGKVKVLFLVGLQTMRKDKDPYNKLRLEKLRTVETSYNLFMKKFLTREIPLEFRCLLDFSHSGMNKCFVNTESVEVIRDTDFEIIPIGKRIKGAVSHSRKLSFEKWLKRPFPMYPKVPLPEKCEEYISRKRTMHGRQSTRKSLRFFLGLPSLAISDTRIPIEKMAATLEIKRETAGRILAEYMKAGLIKRVVWGRKGRNYSRFVALGWLKEVLLEEIERRQIFQKKTKPPEIPEKIEDGNWNEAIFSLAKHFARRRDDHFTRIVSCIPGARKKGKGRIQKCKYALRWWAKLFSGQITMSAEHESFNKIKGVGMGLSPQPSG